MRRLCHFLVVLGLAAAAAPVAARSSIDVKIFNRADGHELPIYQHEGRRYVVGQPGNEYDIRLHNRSGTRMLAVTSVDGVNVVTGQTADVDQAGYVVGAHEQTRIEGWRKNLSEIARFYFTRLPNAYAARTGRPGDVGVIGVALFREQARPCCRWWRKDRQELDRSAPGPQQERPPMAESESEMRDEAAASGRAVQPVPRRRSEKLGTGHGRREDSFAREVEFQRASQSPDRIIAIYYDSHANLVAQGIISPPRDVHVPQPPRPFPRSGFVPDP